MRDKIFMEMRRLAIEKSHVWRFSVYIGFVNSKLTPNEKREFFTFMDELCEEGVFTKEPDGSEVMYRLTEKGEKEVYKE